VRLARTSGLTKRVGQRALALSSLASVDAGFDDVRASVHNTGFLDDPSLIVA